MTNTFWIDYVPPEHRKDNNDKPVRICIELNDQFHILMLTKEDFLELEEQIKIIKKKLKENLIKECK